MQTLNMTVVIAASLEKVWQALVDPVIIERWGAGPAEMNDQTGASFSLWKGDIHGRNLEVVDREKLVQEWYAGLWPTPSKVTLTLTPLVDDGTQIDLVHENIPNQELKEIKQGWEEYYLGAMKDYLEKEPLDEK